MRTSSLYRHPLLQRADHLRHCSGPLTSFITSSPLIHFSVLLTPIFSSLRWFHFPSLLLAQFNFPLYRINASILSSSAINEALSLLRNIENFGREISVIFWTLYTLFYRKLKKQNKNWKLALRSQGLAGGPLCLAELSEPLAARPRYIRCRRQAVTPPDPGSRLASWGLGSGFCPGALAWSTPRTWALP